MKPTPAMLKLIQLEHKQRTGRAYKPPPAALVTECSWRIGDEVWLQIPIRIESPNANGMWYMKAEHAEKCRNAAIDTCRKYLRDLDRTQICGIAFERITTHDEGLDEDNLGGAFKPVLDGTCAWILRGDLPINPRSIGHFDRRVKTLWKGTDKQWPPTYTQSTRKAAHGIRLSFRLLPHSS